MLEIDPSTWTPWSYVLYGFGLWCAGGFVWFWFRFHRLEAAARGGDAAAMEAFHRALMGFPNSVYAKMLGKRKLVAREPLLGTTGRAPGPEGDGGEGQPRDAQPGPGSPGETDASRPPG